MRKIIAAMQTSLDGYIEGPEGELDWAMAEDEESWNDLFEMLKTVDAFILGRVMYPDYEKYWRAVLKNPDVPMPLTGQKASKNDIAYAKLADKIPHYVLTRTQTKFEWPVMRPISSVDAVRQLKSSPGKDIQVVGGATTLSSLMNHGLIDEVRVTVNPLVLGGGKAMFKDVEQRQLLKLVRSKTFRSGKVALVFEVQPQERSGTRDPLLSADARANMF
jgi:dihydrofolate reductase